MKLQDIVFIIILIFLLWKRKPEWFVWGGLIFLVISIPLFAFWVFFTAERLAYYAWAFFVLGVIFFTIQLKNEK